MGRGGKNDVDGSGRRGGGGITRTRSSGWIFLCGKKSWGAASLASGRKVMLDWRGEAQATQVGLGFGTRAGINFHSEKSTAETAEIFCSIWFFHVP